MNNLIGRVLWAAVSGVWTYDYLDHHRPYQAGIAVFSGLICMTVWVDR